MNRLALLSLLVIVGTDAIAQDRLPGMPRYDRYVKLRGEIGGSVKRADASGTWDPDSTAFHFRRDGKEFSVSTKDGAIKEAPFPAANTTAGTRAGQRRAPERGRQFDTIFTADGALKAFHRDRNVYLSKADGTEEVAITTDGSAAERTKNGVASWVYGEELGVREAMWFSPDSKFLAFYRFDEKEVKDYYLAMNVTQIQNALDAEPYPKAGTPNPKVALFLVNLVTRQKVQVDAEFGDASLGHYVYEVRWSPSGDELLYHRTNRKQNIMEFCAANPSTGKSRVIVREEWLPSWTENAPFIHWFEDKKRFLWASERSGFRNFYLGNIDGSPLKQITNHKFDVGNVVRLDEKGNRLWYMARSGDNPHRLQLHRVGLDGRNDKRLTDPKFHHTVNLSPNGMAFVDTAEAIDVAPTVRLCDGEGKNLATISESDLTKFKDLGLQHVERFKFKAADGVTDCYGTLQKPSDFDPGRKYPVIVDVYGGPDSGGSPDRFALPDARTELGFLIVWIDGRGTNGRGKAFKDALYGKLGVVEIDDQAAGVKALAQRPYVDGTRVGIQGTSYGGYSSVMAILRHPDTFHVAVASSSVTAWENYDTIYTERYMGLPWDSENKAGYEAGSAMTYAKNLKGNLMMFYGTADNNVHPANTYQLARALQRAGKRFDLMVGPDQGHAGINGNLELEYFIENLILKRQS